jgi:hypothetical protein
LRGAGKQESGEEYITRSFMFLHLTKSYSGDHITMRLVGRVARFWDGKGAYRVLVGRPHGKRTLGRSKHNLEDNIKIDIQEVG